MRRGAFPVTFVHFISDWKVTAGSRGQTPLLCVSIIPVFSCWRHRTWSLFKLQLCQTPGNCLWFHCCLCSLHRHDCSRRPLGINALSSLWCSNMWRHEGCVFTVPSFPLTTLMLQSIFLNPVRRHANIPPLRSHDVPLGATPQMVALPCEEVLTMVLIYPQNVLDHKLHLIWKESSSPSPGEETLLLVLRLSVEPRSLT